MVASKLTMFLGAGASLAAPANLPVFRWNTISPRVSESISGIETGCADLRRERVVRHHAFVRSSVIVATPWVAVARSSSLANEFAESTTRPKSLVEMFERALSGSFPMTSRT